MPSVSTSCIIRVGVLAASIGFAMSVYGLLSGEFTLAEVGVRAPIQLSSNATTSGLMFVAFITACQFLIGGTFGVFGRFLFLKSWRNPLFWARLNESKWRLFKDGFSYRLMIWLFDLPPVPEPERANH